MVRFSGEPCGPRRSNDPTKSRLSLLWTPSASSTPKPSPTRPMKTPSDTHLRVSMASSSPSFSFAVPKSSIFQ